LVVCLYAKAVFTGYKRGQRNQHEHTALLQAEGCGVKTDARWYLGKRCAYVYKAKNKTSVPNSDAKSQMRVTWGGRFLANLARTEPALP
jgi:large subunit ribosomal protein L35Ae